MDHNPIQAAIAKIEAAAARKTELLLAAQNTYLQACELIDVLKKHAPVGCHMENLKVTPVDQETRMDIIIFSRDYGHAINSALSAAGLVVVGDEKGCLPELRRWTIRDYESVKLYMPAHIAPAAVEITIA